MRRSWLGLQLVLLSCVLLLALVAVEGRHHKEEESSSEEECHCEKRHCCVEKCCKEEECCCEKRHHHKDEEGCKKKHSHGKKDAGKKKPSRVVVEEEEEEAVDEEASEESSEIYKHLAEEEQRTLTLLAAQTSYAVSHTWKQEAIARFNQGSGGTYYKYLEAGQLELKKAIGVMIYIRMLLARTNCTITEEQKEAGVEYSRAYLEKEGCQVLPNKKKHNCTFGIFLDMRTEKKAVINWDCPGFRKHPDY